MSDEPKKRSWTWLRVSWVTLLMVAVLLLLYPLSMPPAFAWGVRNGHMGSVHDFYEPMFRLNRRYRIVRQVMTWYGSIWDVGFIPPEELPGFKGHR